MHYPDMGGGGGGWGMFFFFSSRRRHTRFTSDWSSDVCSSDLYADRFRFMTDPARADVPWETLVSKAYAIGRYDLIGPDALTDGVKPGDAWAYQAEAREGQRVKGETSTTHLCTADGRGGLVSLTNTLGGGWGSEVIPGNTGIVWNNGMFWFDPVPGRLTSVAPRRFGLNNMTPAIVFTPDGRALAVGASGGRRITNCVAQLVGNIVDHSLGEIGRAHV